MDELSHGQQRRILLILTNVFENGGELFLHNDHIDNSILWESHVQDSLRSTGYELTIYKSKAVTNHRKTEIAPEMMIIRSPEFAKKKIVKIKMKKEFGN